MGLLLLNKVTIQIFTYPSNLAMPKIPIPTIELIKLGP